MSSTDNPLLVHMISECRSSWQDSLPYRENLPSFCTIAESYSQDVNHAISPWPKRTHQTERDFDRWRRRHILLQLLLYRHRGFLPLELPDIHLPTKLDRFLRLDQPRDISYRQTRLSPCGVSCLQRTKSVGCIANNEDVLVHHLNLALVTVWPGLLGDLKEAVDGDGAVVDVDGFGVQRCKELRIWLLTCAEELDPSVRETHVWAKGRLTTSSASNSRPSVVLITLSTP